MGATITDKPVTLAIEAHAHRGWQKGAQWAVTVTGTNVYGRGPTLTHARHDATEQIASLVQNVTESPACVRDGDGSLWMFAPHGDGHQSRRIRPDGIASNCHSVGSGTPAEAAEQIVKHHDGAVRVF